MRFALSPWLARYKLEALTAMISVGFVISRLALLGEPEVIPHGAAVGEVLNDLALALLAAVAFQIFMIDRPRRRRQVELLDGVALQLYRAASVSELVIFRTVEANSTIDEPIKTRDDLKRHLGTLDPAQKMTGWEYDRSTFGGFLGSAVAKAQHNVREASAFLPLLDPAVAKSILALTNGSLASRTDIYGSMLQTPSNKRIPLFDEITPPTWERHIWEFHEASLALKCQLPPVDPLGANWM